MRMRSIGTLLAAAAMAVTGTALPAQAAEGKVIGAGAPGAIPGRYIVTLRKTAAGDLSAQGAGSYTASMTAQQARRLAARSDVAIVEQDRVLHIEGTQVNPPWGLDRIDQRSATGNKRFTPMDDGSSVTAYVIDTGIQINHVQFAGRARYGWDFVGNDAVAADCNGHGTHVAGTIGGSTYGVAKKVKLVAVRVLDCNGEGTLSGVIDGVHWVTANAARPAVANMSLGGSASASLNAAVADSIAHGVTYAVAAGNENTNASYTSPGGVPAAITVGATDSRDRRASFSNYGSVLDLFAPGVNILSSVYSPTSNNATGVYSGTSMASPHVAGAAALVLDAAPTYTPAQVRAFLVGKATAGKVADPKGSPNRLLFVPAPPAAPVITTTAVALTAGKWSSTQLAASRRGTWALASGTLPTGVKLTTGGLISGTPTAPGSATVQVRFTDYVPYAVTRTIAVSVATSTPVLGNAALPPGTVGDSYYTELTADRPGTWALAGGSLPAGLDLGPDGSISGTATATGEFTFQAGFTDYFGTTATAAYAITVN
jgi:subtilisin family serine protease